MIVQYAEKGSMRNKVQCEAKAGMHPKIITYVTSPYIISISATCFSCPHQLPSSACCTLLSIAWHCHNYVLYHLFSILTLWYLEHGLLSLQVSMYIGESSLPPQCNHLVALSSFFKQINFPPTKVGWVGSGCSPATEPTAELTQFYNMTQVHCYLISRGLYQYQHTVKITSP